MVPMLSDIILLILAIFFSMLVLFLYLAIKFFSAARKRAYPRTPRFQVYMIRNGQTVAQSLYSPPAYSLTVVIPAYKEELRIEKMLTNTIRYLEKRAMETPKFKAEIIIVDDGSTDKTVGKVKEVTKKLSPPLTDVKLISFPYNQGKGAAISEGILASLGKEILFADADGATEIEEIEKLEDVLVSNGLACGSRYATKNGRNQVQRSPIRQKLMKVFHDFVQFYGVDFINDTQCGFKLFTREAARRIIPNLRINGWIFDVEILLLAKYFRVKVKEVPVDWREIEGSKLRLVVDAARMALDLFFMRFAYESRIWKIYGRTA